MIIPSLGEFVVVVVEDHCGGRTLGAGTHVTKRLHLLVLASRVPISRQRVSWYPGGNTPRIM